MLFEMISLTAKRIYKYSDFVSWKEVLTQRYTYTERSISTSKKEVENAEELASSALPLLLIPTHSGMIMCSMIVLNLQLWARTAVGIRDNDYLPNISIA